MQNLHAEPTCSEYSTLLLHGDILDSLHFESPYCFCLKASYIRPVAPLVLEPFVLDPMIHKS